MIRRCRQIELDELWADIGAGEFKNMASPARTFPGP